jgi:hypothetical protein
MKRVLQRELNQPFARNLAAQKLNEDSGTPTLKYLRGEKKHRLNQVEDELLF